MMTNATNLKTVSNIQNICENRCKYMMCTYSYCITNGYSKATKLASDSDDEQISTIHVESFPSPSIYITYVPNLPFLDFVIYVCSTLGSWFGFVIVSFNPLNVYKIKKFCDKKKKNRNRNDQTPKNMFHQRSRISSSRL